MDLALLWQVPCAMVGFVVLRQVVHPTGWGHTCSTRFVAAVIGSLLVRPLAGNPAPWAIPFCAGGLVVAWFPWWPLALWWLERTTKRGLRRLAAERGGTFVDEGDGLFGVQGDGFRIWNVLTEARSLHPGSDRRETYCMLAYTVALPPSPPPPLLCCAMKGWQTPKYYDRHWRRTTVVQGDVMALSLGVDAEGAVETGGDCRALQPLAAEELDERWTAFTVLANDGEAFARVFGGETADEFLDATQILVQFELDVTPTTLTFYTIYGGYEAGRVFLDLALTLARRLQERR